MRTTAQAPPRDAARQPRWHARAARAIGGALLRRVIGAVLLGAVIAGTAWAVHGLILVIRAIP